MRTTLPLDLWLGRGRPLNPYLKGFLVEFLRKELKPKDLKLAPESFFEQAGMGHFFGVVSCSRMDESLVASSSLVLCYGAISWSLYTGTRQKMHQS